MIRDPKDRVNRRANKIMYLYGKFKKGVENKTRIIYNYTIKID